jgi:hypothetical protein
VHSFATPFGPTTTKKPSQKVRGSSEDCEKDCCGCFAPLTPFRGRVQDPENIKVEERRGSMTKVAILILADTESNEGLGRVVNALSVAKEFKEEGQG